MNHSYFPQIEMKYTSDKHHGQVYIPIANWLLMIGCVIVTAVYNNTTNTAQMPARNLAPLNLVQQAGRPVATQSVAQIQASQQYQVLLTIKECHPRFLRMANPSCFLGGKEAQSEEMCLREARLASASWVTAHCRPAKLLCLDLDSLMIF